MPPQTSPRKKSKFKNWRRTVFWCSHFLRWKSVEQFYPHSAPVRKVCVRIDALRNHEIPLSLKRRNKSIPLLVLTIASLSLALCRLRHRIIKKNNKDMRRHCTKNFKYMQSNLLKLILICLHTRHPEMKRLGAKKRGSSCLHVHSLWPKIPSNYIWQPALYLNLIMSFCIQSNKGLLNAIMKMCIIIHCSPLNESPCCPFCKWALYQELFKPLALKPKTHTEMCRKDCFELWVIQNWHHTLIFF